MHRLAAKHSERLKSCQAINSRLMASKVDLNLKLYTRKYSCWSLLFQPTVCSYKLTVPRTQYDRLSQQQPR